MVTKKIISTLLAVLMLVGTFTIVTGAEDAASKFVPEYNTSPATPAVNYMTSQSDHFDSEAVVIATPQEKLDTMDCRLEKDGYRLYVDAYSGEVAVESLDSGETLFTNPYDLSNITNPENKAQLLSQLVVTFKDITADTTQVYQSSTWTSGKAYKTQNGKLTNDAERDKEMIETSQIMVRNIKNGLRVEYTIGREQTKMLVPRVISKDAYETKILKPLLENLEIFKKEVYDQCRAEGMSESSAELRAQMQYDLQYGKFKFYKLFDPEQAATDAEREAMYAAYPITKQMAVYVLDETLKTTERARIEQRIKTYVPTYTYEELDADHLLVGYVDKDKTPPLFNMALEYTLDKGGLTVRLPANGISFNESLYELISIDILPYMGAGDKNNEGYTFFPDGSGTLFDFQDIASIGANMTVTGTVYGTDYAYHDISEAGAYQEEIRYPVFGIVEEEQTTDMYNRPTTKERGYVAIVEEGDAMMKLIAEHETTTTQHNTVKMRVYPRPQDTYNVADAISVGQNDTWTVVSSRKYTGSYKIRYIMLTPEETAPDTIETFDTSYIGMAKAYRTYLEDAGVLTALSGLDSEHIPLYIETFGAMQTTERFLSIPMDVMTPLTTFGDIKTIYDSLATEDVDITNVNFILTGYTEGGLSSPKVPYNLNWEGAVEKGFENSPAMNFKQLSEYAIEQGFGLFPDFDFAFVKQDAWFDGLSLDQHAVKTIDDRYTSKREYSATKQTYVSYFELALSPAYFSHFYTKLTDNYKNYLKVAEDAKIPGISVSTLGSYLNSDFDEDEPFNRSDAQAFTVEAFRYLDENYENVMTAGGNAYTWKYVDYITDIALDSSRFSDSSASVPFLGIVLHGYVQFAGNPINMEGNIDYAVLKAIESGAGLQFILSYRNTANLKNDENLSKYYSIRYNIWIEDLIEIYKEVNHVLKGVQMSTIEDHKFIEGVRVPDNDELEADAKAAIEAALKAEAEKRAEEQKAEAYLILSARKLLKGDATAPAKILNLKKAMDASDIVVTGQETMKDMLVALTAAERNFTDAVRQYKAGNLTALDVYDYMIKLKDAADAAMKKMNQYLDDYNTAKDGYALMVEHDIYAAERDALKANLDLVEGEYAVIAAVEAQILTVMNGAMEAYGALADVPEVEPYEYKDPKAEEDDKSSDENVVADKYVSDSNKIVYEEYANGTVFLLNFNDYAVVVKHPVTEVTYTIEAYGYVFLPPVND